MRKGSRDTAPGSLRELEIPCYLQLADEREFSREGKLDFASSEVNKSTGTARVRGVFDNRDHSLASGLFVRVRIPVSDPYQALLIPERAIAADQSVKFTYVVAGDGTAERRTVELGAQRGGMRIVTAGLKAGERVVSKGLQRVRPGQKVEAEMEKGRASQAPTPNRMSQTSSEKAESTDAALADTLSPRGKQER